MSFVVDIPPSEFSALTAELCREPISVNYDRAQAGKGKSQAFGIIRRWSYRPFLSRNTWMRPVLYQLLLDFAARHVAITWDGITVNDSYVSAPHRDKGNQGHSYTVSFGDFTGGELCIGNPAGEFIKIDTHNKGYLFNGAGETHWTAPFQGRRFCLVFYSIVWPTKFLPRYKIRCYQEADGLYIDDEYDESIVVINHKGKEVRIIKPPVWRPWIGRLTRLAQPSRNLLPPPGSDTSASLKI